MSLNAYIGLYYCHLIKGFPSVSFLSVFLGHMNNCFLKLLILRRKEKRKKHWSVINRHTHVGYFEAKIKHKFGKIQYYFLASETAIVDYWGAVSVNLELYERIMNSLIQFILPRLLVYCDSFYN